MKGMLGGSSDYGSSSISMLLLLFWLLCSFSVWCLYLGLLTCFVVRAFLVMGLLLLFCVCSCLYCSRCCRLICLFWLPSHAFVVVIILTITTTTPWCCCSSCCCCCCFSTSLFLDKPLLSGPDYVPTYSVAAMTRKRPMTAEDAEGHGGGSKEGALVRCLTWPDLITYGLGSTVGAGVSLSPTTLIHPPHTSSPTSPHTIIPHQSYHSLPSSPPPPPPHHCFLINYQHSHYPI